MTSVTDANGNVTRYAFDLNNRKIREDRPSVAGTAAARRVTEYFYDGADHLVREVTKSATGGADRVIAYTYDALDRLVHKTVQNDGAGIPDDDSTFTYENQLDATLMKTAVNGVSSLTYTNEAAPPFASSAVVAGASQSGNPLGLITGTFAVTRDVTGEVASVSKDGTSIFTKSYDPAGRLIGVAATGGFSSTIGYDGFGRKTSVAHSDGASGSFQRDLLDRITQVAWTGPTPISESLGYDVAGNITQLQRENGTYSVGYDSVNQLVSSATTGTANYNKSFGYDALGNRVSGTDGPGTVVGNFLTQNGTSSFTADPSGFGDTISEVSASASKNYAYRADDLLNAAQAGSTQAAYYFDALGRRVAKVVNQGGQSFTQTYAYVGKDNNALLGKAGDGSITTYIDGQAPNDHLGEVKAGVGKGYVTDHLGSVLNGEVAGSGHSFGIFGEVLGTPPALSATSSPVMYGWQGLSYDAESGQWDNKARQYNQNTGTFASQDPIGIAGGLNVYGSRRNNPLRFADPFGEDVTVIYYGGGVRHIGISVNGGPSYGYYPDNPGASFSVLVGTVPGGEVDDKNHQGAGQEIKKVTIHTTQDQDSSVLNYISQLSMHPGQYNAFGNGGDNCATQAGKILNNSGVSVPSTWNPKSFIEQLGQQYPQ